MPDITIQGATYPDVPAVDLPKSGGGNARFYDPNEILYAASPTSGGSATYANAIHYGAVDGTSTSTAFTATIDGITTLYDGLTILLYNGVVTSAANYTININNLGAYGTYNNMTLGNSITPTAATRDTTIFNINYAMLMIFSTHITGGITGWICYRGYDANTNTIGYQIRGNSSSLPMTDKVYRYRLLFTSADGSKFVPANTSSATNATTARSVCQTPIDPFGRIVYYGSTSAVNAGSRPSVSSLWTLYQFTFGYSFNMSGGDLTLTAWKPIYIKCAPQSDGSAIIDSTTPYVQALPSTEDGKIYIFLGIAYSATSVELFPEHPVYYYKDGCIRLWTNAPSGLPSVSSSDNGKVLRVVNGAWSAVQLPSASGVSF